MSLPNGYTQLEYIQSSGTQYIDTGVLAQSDLKIEMQAELTTTDGSQAFFGGQNSTSSNRLAWYYYKNTEMYYYYASSKYPFVKRSDFASKHIYVFDNNKVYIDGVTVSFSTSISATSFTSSYTMYLFARNLGGTASDMADMKLYYFKVWKNDELLGDFVPAKRKSDGEIGLYDVESGVFYSNQGTGTFIAGQELTDDEWEEPKEPEKPVINKLYYNGILLPAIPADALAEYPYAWIKKSSGKYQLIMAKYPFYTNGVYVYCSNGLSETKALYSISISNVENISEWTFEKYETGYYFANILIWSNHDMPYGSATATDIHFYGSEPVDPNAPNEPDTPALVIGMAKINGVALPITGGMVKVNGVVLPITGGMTKINGVVTPITM
jgi:hypothetical protein